MGQKRNRISKVCDFCKRRKVKCDLGNPCSMCVKYKKSPCVYSEQPTEAPKSKQKKPRVVKSEITNNNDTSSGVASNGSSNSGYTNSSASTAVSIPSSMTYANSYAIESNNNNSTGVSINNSQSCPTLFQSATTVGGGSAIVHNELSFLKEKLKSLEDSILLKQDTLQGNNNAVISSSCSPNDSVHSQKPYFIPSLTNTPIDLTSLLGINPVASDTETINFYRGYNGTTDKEPLQKRNHGPLSWIALTKSDNAMRTLWAHIHIVKEQIRARMLAISDNAPQVDKEFTEKAIYDEGQDNLRPFRDAVEKDPKKPPTPATVTHLKNNSQSQMSLNQKAMCLGLLFYRGGLDQELELVEKIRLVLPKQEIIWLLFKRFFTHLYTALPILDEVVLKEELQKLIGPEDYSQSRVGVKIEKKLDFAYLGILLLVLRLSYVSLFSYDLSINENYFTTDDPSPKAQQTKYLLNNPINIDVVSVAQECFNQFNIMRNCNMTLMQLALLTRIYHQVAPEDGDGIDGGDSQIFTGMLVQMAYSLGLHRDPDNVPDSSKDQKLNNLGRKIWYMVLVQDFSNAMGSGSMLCVNVDSFDTKIPFYVPGNENVIDVEVEKIACSCFPNLESTYNPLCELLNMILRVKGEVKMIDLSKKMKLMENHFKDKYRHFTSPSEDSRNSMPATLKKKIFFSGNLFMVSIYMHIFNYYEAKQNVELSFFYLKKMFVTTIFETMPYFTEYVTNTNDVFNSGSDIIAIPGYESVAHKSLIVIAAIYLRLMYRIRMFKIRYDHNTRMNSDAIEDEEYKAHFNKLIKCSDLLIECREIFRCGLAKLSNRYYYAWRVTKAQNFIGSMITDKFFESYKPKCVHNGYSTEMITELIYILESTLDRVREMKKLRKLHQKQMKNQSHSKQVLQKLHYHQLYQLQQLQLQQLQQQLQQPQSQYRSQSHSWNGTGANPQYSYGDQNLLGERNPSLDQTSMASNTSSDVDINDYKTNDEIDSIWLQMMNLKNQDTIGTPGNTQFGGGGSGNWTTSFQADQSNMTFPQVSNNPAGGNVANVSLGQGSELASGSNDMGHVNYTNNAGGPGTNSLFNPLPNLPNTLIDMNNLFENVPLDELFKDFS